MCTSFKICSPLAHGHSAAIPNCNALRLVVCAPLLYSNSDTPILIFSREIFADTSSITHSVSSMLARNFRTLASCAPRRPHAMSLSLCVSFVPPFACPFARHSLSIFDPLQQFFCACLFFCLCYHPSIICQHPFESIVMSLSDASSPLRCSVDRSAYPSRD